MRRFLVVLSVAALAWLAAAAVLFCTGALDLERTKIHLLLATVLWFVSTPFWMAREPA
jgi:hypothetical protein